MSSQIPSFDEIRKVRREILEVVTAHDEINVSSDEHYFVKGEFQDLFLTV